MISIYEDFGRLRNRDDGSNTYFVVSVDLLRLPVFAGNKNESMSSYVDKDNSTPLQ
jgi:hypothetical protein